jgi:uncharacterized protein YegP (UPF0339 family)
MPEAAIIVAFRPTASRIWTPNAPGKEKEPSMYFVIRRNSAGQYWWRGVANNNEILCASELMTSKAACLNGINVVKAEAADAPVYDKTAGTAVRKAV